MKILVFADKVACVGGVQTAQKYIIQALNSVGVETTTNPNDNYDLVDMQLFVGRAGKIAKYCKKHGIPFIMHGHSTSGDMTHSFRWWPLVMHLWFKPGVYNLYKKADLIIPVSHFCKDLIEPDIIYSGVPLKVVNNALDLKEFKKDNTKIDAFEKYFNINKDDKVVINAASIFERKGLPDFIEVAKRNPNVKFIWFGETKGFIWNPKMKKLIKHLPNNMIMPGQIRDDIFFGALQRANCVFYPSFVETDGYVALEAMASKTPLLVRDIGALEWLEDGVHCYKGNNVEEFNEKLHLILENDNTKMTDTAYRKVKKERDLKVIGEQLKQVYQEILNNKNKENEIK